MVEARASILNHKTSMPVFVPPCLARLGNEVPDGPGWVHEVKFDGYRLQVRIDNGTIKLLTRTGLDWTARFGTLADVLRKLPLQSAIIDGEAIVEDARGASHFATLVDALKSRKTERIVFVAFDLLFLDGKDLAVEHLGDRKLQLGALLLDAPDRVRYSEHLPGDGTKMLSAACKMGLEGIISKRLDKPYRSGRHDDWRKTKCVQTDEFVIVGYTDSTAIENSIGALAVAFYDGKKLVYAGRVGTGFNRATAAVLWKTLQPLRHDKSPLPATLDRAQRSGVTWVTPSLVAQLEYRTVTGSGLLRHASFQALREDLPASQVKRPKPGHT